MQDTSLAGRSILVVADEPLIPLDLVTALKQAGAVVLAARSLAEASGLVEHDGLSAALLDFGLGDDDAGALCVRLGTAAHPLAQPRRPPPPEPIIRGINAKGYYIWRERKR